MIRFQTEDEEYEEALENDRELREHTLIFSGFIAGSALTAIVFLASLGTKYLDSFELSIIFTLLALACIFSTFSGFFVFVGVYNRSLDRPSERLELLSTFSSIIGATFFVSNLPFLVPYNPVSYFLIFASLATLLSFVFYGMSERD